MYLIYLIASAVIFLRFISDKSDKSASLFFIKFTLIFTLPLLPPQERHLQGARCQLWCNYDMLQGD